MKRFALIIMIATVLLVNTASAAISTVNDDMTEAGVLQYLYAPASSAEAQAIKDRVIWDQLADGMFNVD